MMPYEPGEELLEYQTEQEDVPEPAAPGPPVEVRVCDPVVTVPTVPQHITCKTVVLSDATPVQILALDPLRTRAQLVVADTNDVVLCHSVTQAQNPNNADPTLARPDGTIIPGTLTAPVEVDATGPAWLVANTFPTRVGLIIERRGA